MKFKERNPEQIDEHCVALYLEVPGSKVVLFQTLFEAFEGIGVVRTLSIQRSLICVLTTPDYLSTCVELLESLRENVPWRFVDRPIEAEQQLYFGYFRNKENVTDPS